MKTITLTSCNGCPFVSPGPSFLNKCGRKGQETDAHGLSKWGVNDDWRAPLPTWCPLIKAPVTVRIAPEVEEPETAVVDPRSPAARRRKHGRTP
jgi:hypothetical protein